MNMATRKPKAFGEVTVYTTIPGMEPDEAAPEDGDDDDENDSDENDGDSSA